MESKGFERDTAFGYPRHYHRASTRHFHVERFVKQERSVDVTITTEDRTPFGVIAEYQSSVVMNAVGWDGIYVMFPEYTFNNLLLCRLDHGVFMDQEGCIAKYYERG